MSLIEEIEAAGGRDGDGPRVWSGLMNVQLAVQGDQIFVLRGESARLKDGALCLEVHRSVLGEDCGAVHGGTSLKSARVHAAD